MPCYISSNENRFYVEAEVTYGQVAAVTENHRFPAVKLSAKQAGERAERRDKTGGRTFAGIPPGGRRRTSYELKTYMTAWDTSTEQPGYGPLFRAAMGAAPLRFAGGTIEAASGNELTFTGLHGLTSGQGITFGGELRFAAAVIDASRVSLNAPFTFQPTAGTPAGPTITYVLGSDPSSVSLYDYWSPAEAVQRVLCGAAVDKLALSINGDFHEFEFSGPAADLLDSASFLSGQGGLIQYPSEPGNLAFNYAVIPGHLGQVWLGSTPERFYTLTGADLKLDNAINLRSNEFGSEGPRCVSAGRRNVSLGFSLYQQDNEATRSLYDAARQRSPISAIFQLGQQQGQLMGVYLKSVVPEVPTFDDSDTRLQWKFVNCRAQGTVDDEMSIAFG
ncbi:MAG TPA: hypothetical protein VMZ52_03500 [Bryobacteraceae bacterium]|nr:hypothetical protein [Bryobacteraceae bacterium]